MSKKNKNKRKNHKNLIRSSGIQEHKQEGSVLKPPFRQLPGMTNSSWVNERMPEMLWAVLLIGNMEREDSLNIFRKVSAFVEMQPELSDVTHSGISKWAVEERISFIKLLKESHPDSQKILQALVIFPEIPGYEEWVAVLDKPADINVALSYLSKGVLVNLDHQSQEATDCRWIKFVCKIHSGKVKFFSGLEGIEETLRGLDEYPNYGDLGRIRGFIRASEMMIDMTNEDEKVKNNWSEKFWNNCLQTTLCGPLPIKKQRVDNLRVDHNQIQKTRVLLLLEYMRNDNSTDVDSKHDTIFGFGFYALRLLDELVATNLSRGAIGRIVLRSCVESYVTMTYLIKKNDQSLWDDYRNYGIGQTKLSYLKTRDLTNKPSFIDEEFLKEIINEDRSEEFSDIELSNWTSLNLRDMSVESGCKDIYDAYYGWTSTFSHGSWGAVRESAFVKCANPLHRLHLIPSANINPLPGVLEDMVNIVNMILASIKSQYNGQILQIVNTPKPLKQSFFKKIYNKFRYNKFQTFLNIITSGYRPSKRKSGQNQKGSNN